MRKRALMCPMLAVSFLAGCGDSGVGRPDVETPYVDPSGSADAALDLAVAPAVKLDSPTVPEATPGYRPNDVAATGEATYSARFVPGGFDRITIYKADSTSDVCVILGLKSPATGAPSSPAITIQMPQRWQVEFAMELPGSASCGSPWPPPPTSGVSASAGSGQVIWDASGGGRLWCGAGGIDVGVTLTFRANSAGLPRVAVLSARVVPAGC